MHTPPIYFTGYAGAFAAYPDAAYAIVAGLFNALYIHPGGKCESTVQQLGKTCEPA
jgi:hypothetical protein